MNERKTTTPAIEATIEGTVLTLTFSHGKTLVLDSVQMPPAIIDAALLHGLKQKLVDAAAMSRNPENGRAASIEDKYEAVHEVYERLLAGQWNKPRGDGSGAGGVLFKALCRMYTDKTPEQIKTFLDGKTDAEKSALRRNAKVAAVIAEIQAETGAKSGIDSDEILGELGDA